MDISYIQMVNYFMNDLMDNKERTQQRVDHYYNIYFSLKKRKDISRKRKSRLMKDAEKEWQLWKGILEWENNLFNF